MLEYDALPSRSSCPCVAVRLLATSALVMTLVVLAAPVASAEGLDFAHLAALRDVRQVALSPDGALAAYVLAVPRRPGVDDNGPAHNELHVVPFGGGPSRAFVHGEVSVSRIAFTPDGSAITYLAKRSGDSGPALWAIPVDGGESRKLAEAEGGISSYEISSDGRYVAYLSAAPEGDARRKARDKGYDQEVFEEEWRPTEVWVAELPPASPAVPDPLAPAPKVEPRQLKIEGSVTALAYSPDGERLALSVAPRALVDDQIMRLEVRIVDVADGKVRTTLPNPGKLSTFAWSPDGRHLALIGPAGRNDPSPGRLLLVDTTSGAARDLLPSFEAHVRQAAWRDAEQLVWMADLGAETVLGETTIGGGDPGAEPSFRLRSGVGDVPVLREFDLSSQGHVLLRAESPRHPTEVFALAAGAQSVERLTESNPWLAEIELAEQEVVRWTASDGLELEGVLIHPLGKKRGPAPLLLMVHGGPESQDRNGWVTGYSRPGQLAAARGYAVLYPNYRGSTGRGVEFSKISQGDPAGDEFRDLVEAVDFLVAEGIADVDRVGITGGSYGGYATAWCSTFYSDRFRAGVAFVGVTNVVSKTFTTDIPIENLEVHTLYNPWERWELTLERSPLRWAERSKTPLLIAGGTADPRVHPSQSLQLYRALKLQDKTVRYVRYPDERHGNRKAAARDDYTRRLMRWMDHFILDGRDDLPPVALPDPESSGSTNGR